MAMVVVVTIAAAVVVAVAVVVPRVAVVVAVAVAVAVAAVAVVVVVVVVVVVPRVAVVVAVVAVAMLYLHVCMLHCPLAMTTSFVLKHTASTITAISSFAFIKKWKITRPLTMSETFDVVKPIDCIKCISPMTPLER